MTARQRMIPAALLGLLSASAIGHGAADPMLGQSVLREPAFWAALLPALAAGFLGARAFGRRDPGAVARSVVVGLMALVLGYMAAVAITGGPALSGIARPMAAGSAAAGWLAAHMAAWRLALRA